MSNILDYLDWRGDVTFAQSPFCEVDNLILCKLCCADFTGVIPEEGEPMSVAEAAEGYFAAHPEGSHLGVLIPAEIPALVKKLPETARFKDMLLYDYINRIDLAREEQFSALTAWIPDGTAFVAFRGTDDTIVAWKENFNMGASDAVPAQQDAETYLRRAAWKTELPLRVGGHSKGGNLAVFSALHNDPQVQDRILDIYNNDGPGFRESVLDTPAYRRIRARVSTLVPQYSLVGMLLSHEEEYEIIRSDETGTAAHNGFTWEVRGTRFVRCRDFALRSRLFDSAFHAWAAEMDLEQRQRFVDALFSVLTSTGATTLTDLNEHKIRQAIELVNTLRQEPKQRELLTETLELLIREYVTSARAVLPLPKMPQLPQLPRMPFPNRTKRKKKDE